MKITEISYRSLRTGRGYNNTAVEARAEIGSDQTPEEALADLRAWVDQQVDEHLKRQDIYEKISDLNERLGYLLKEEETVKRRVEEMRTLLRERHKLADLARSRGLGGDALLLENL